jgi:hypothetical protein
VYSLSGSLSISDERDKKNIDQVSIGLDFVRQLKPKKFQYKSGSFTNYKLGFIAQDILAIDPEYIGILHDTESDRYSLATESLIVPLVNSIKELYNIIDTQQQQIAALHETVVKLLAK